MKYALLTFIASFRLVASIFAQAPQPDPVLTKGASNTWNLDWEGVYGRGYYLQHSEDLINWQYFPLMEMGWGNTIPYGFASSGEKFFVRLLYTDDMANFWGDYDGDGISNWNEIHIYGTDPFNADTDGDGVPDGVEVELETDPNNASSKPEFWWQMTTRSLQYDYDDYEPPYNIGWLSREATWNASLNTNEQLSQEIPFTNISDRLDQISFPGSLTALHGANGLESAAGNSVLLPNPPCYHATLNHHRFWLRRSIADSMPLHKTIVLITERSVDEVEQSKLIEFTESTIPANQLVSEGNDAMPGFDNDFSGNQYHSETVVTTPYEVKIERDLVAGVNDWQPVAGNLAKALPGERINLKIDMFNFPTNVTVDNFQWILPDKTFKNYFPTLVLGELEEMKADDLNKSRISFYFTTSGQKEVQLKFDVDGTNVEARVLIEVVEPVSTFTTEKGAVRLGESQIPGVHALGFFGETEPLFGVRYIASVTTPEGWDIGTFAFAQLIKYKRDFTNPPNNQATVIGDGIAWKHDGPFPYGSTNAVFAADGTVFRSFGDSPFEGADSDLRNTIQISDSFQTYLIFRPAGIDSRYVPLRKINWNWGGKATTNDNWTTVTDPIANVDEEGIKTDQHPEWEDNSENDIEHEVE